ncbi:MAG: helix-turn-helix domain-containing protein [Tunicatimonas sp.]|uniref:helix-turn-helix domain-containing protein n=1 Tax=Tunicatimonas sp. TaxID=1940096 RepID=UPI003C73CBAC
MKESDTLAKRLRARRVQRGYSQEFLAERANINTRTLQRIEAGQTEPRGHTLIALAQGLDIAMDDLMDFTKRENSNALHAINLSALAYWAFPLGNIILPLTLWIINKDKVKGANQFGRRQVLIQSGWTGVIFLSYINFFLNPWLYNIGDFGGTLAWLTFPLTTTFIVYGLNTCYIIIVSILISKNQQVPLVGLN